MDEANQVVFNIHDYNGMTSLLAAHKYARLSAKKDLNVDEEKKKQVKDLRDTEKHLWKELEEHYFSQSEEHILEALKYCRTRHAANLLRDWWHAVMRPEI